MKMKITNDKYRNLMFWKNFFIFFNPIFFLGSFLIFGFFAVIPICICVYISMMVFLAKNICPWCNNSFFIYTERGAEMDGLSFLTQTKCINCGKPDNTDSSL